MALRDLPPAFRRTNSVVPTPTFAPQGDADLANVLSGISRQSADKVRRLGVEAAAERGTQVGEVLGSPAPRSKLTDADRAYNRAWETAQSGAIQIDIRDSLQRIRQEVTAPGQLNSNSQVAYQERVKSYVEGMLPNVAPELRTKATNYLSYYNSQNQGIVDKQVTQLQKNQLSTKYFEYRNKATRDIEQAAFDAPFQGDVDNQAAGALYGQLAQQTHEAVLSGLITPKMGEDILNNAQQKAQQENYLGQFDVVLRSDDPKTTQKWLRDFEKSRQKDMTPDEKRNLIVKMVKLQKEHQSLQETNRINLAQEKKNAISMIEHGASPDEIMSTLERVNRYDTPEQQDRFQGQIQAAVLQSNIADALRETPPSQVPGLLSQLELDKDDPFFAQKQDVIDKVDQMQERFRKELLDDPAAYALSTPTVQKTIQERGVSAFDVTRSGVRKVQPGDSPISNDVDSQMLSVQRRMEVPEEQLSLLPKKTLETFSNQLSRLSFEEQIGAIEQEIESHDRDVQNIVLRDLQKAGLTPAHSLVLNSRYSRDPNVMRDIPNMMQAFSESKQDLKKAITSGEDIQNLKELIAQNNDEYHATLMNYKGPSEQAMSQLLEDQEQVALFLMARKGISKDEAVQRAGLPLNGAFQFEELKGSSYRIPRYTQTTQNMEPVLTDIRAVRSQADLMIRQAVEADNIFVPDEYMTGVSREVAKINYMKDLTANSTIMTLPDNTGIAVIDAYGNIVKTDDGITFQSKFSDIQNDSHRIKNSHVQKFGGAITRDLVMNELAQSLVSDTFSQDVLASTIAGIFEDQ